MTNPNRTNAKLDKYKDGKLPTANNNRYLDVNKRDLDKGRGEAAAARRAARTERRRSLLQRAQNDRQATPDEAVRSEDASMPTNESMPGAFYHNNYEDNNSMRSSTANEDVEVARTSEAGEVNNAGLPAGTNLVIASAVVDEAPRRCSRLLIVSILLLVAIVVVAVTVPTTLLISKNEDDESDNKELPEEESGNIPDPAENMKPSPSPTPTPIVPSLPDGFWTQIGEIDGESAGDRSGGSISISSDGKVVAIGAEANGDSGQSSGHVRVFECYESDEWTQRGGDIDGEASLDRSGFSISLSSDGNVLAIGAIENDGAGSNSGHVRVFEYTASEWVQRGEDIDGESPEDWSGYSVSLSSDGSRVAVGAIFNDGSGDNSGHVRVFQYQEEGWTQIGEDIGGEISFDWFGFSVSLSADGNTLAVGAALNNGNGNDSGHVRVFGLINGAWTQRGSDIDGESAEDQSGYSVSLSADGNVVAIGAPFNDGNGDNSGHVRIFEYFQDEWIQRGEDIDGEAEGDQSGFSVSLSSDGKLVAIGANLNDGKGINSGHVRVYEFMDGAWTKRGQDIDGETDFDESGWSVSLSSDGNHLAVGAIVNDGNGDASGHTRVYRFSEEN